MIFDLSPLNNQAYSDDVTEKSLNDLFCQTMIDFTRFSMCGELLDKLTQTSSEVCLLDDTEARLYEKITGHLVSDDISMEGVILSVLAVIRNVIDRIVRAIKGMFRWIYQKIGKWVGLYDPTELRNRVAEFARNYNQVANYIDNASRPTYTHIVIKDEKGNTKEEYDKLAIALPYDDLVKAVDALAEYTSAACTILLAANHQYDAVMGRNYLMYRSHKDPIKLYTSIYTAAQNYRSILPGEQNLLTASGIHQFLKSRYRSADEMEVTSINRLTNQFEVTGVVGHDNVYDAVIEYEVKNPQQFDGTSGDANYQSIRDLMNQKKRPMATILDFKYSGSPRLDVLFSKYSQQTGILQGKISEIEKRIADLTRTSEDAALDKSKGLAPGLIRQFEESAAVQQKLDGTPITSDMVRLPLQSCLYAYQASMALFKSVMEYSRVIHNTFDSMCTQYEILAKRNYFDKFFNR